MSALLPLLLVLAAAMAVVAVRQRLAVTTIHPPAVGLLYRDGRFVRELPPGRYAWFDPLGRRRVVEVATAEVPVTLPEVTVLSRDQFSFRLAFAPVLAVTDARLFAESQPAAPAFGRMAPVVATHAALHPTLAAAALEAVGTRTLAEIIAAPAELTAAVQARLADAVPGASVTRLLLTAINLPPETRRMFTDVERARMEAQAALERARGEQAALRVLANAARLVEGNPALGHLRLLQAIESAKGATTIVLGEATGFPVPGKAPPAA